MIIDDEYTQESEKAEYRELTKSERNEMLFRYFELLPYYEKKAEVADARGFCPMDILHEIILNETTERTLKTMAIREACANNEYVSCQKYTIEQVEFDLEDYVRKHEKELSEKFKIVI